MSEENPIGSIFSTREVPDLARSPLVPLAVGLASKRGWKVQSCDENGVGLTAEGLWRIYHLEIRLPAAAMLQLQCSFHLRVPDNRLLSLYRTLSKISQDLLYGAFLYDEASQQVTLLGGVMQDDSGDSTGSSLVRLLDLLITECDKCYPALQVAASRNAAPPEAIQAAILEPMGSA